MRCHWAGDSTDSRAMLRALKHGRPAHQDTPDWLPSPLYCGRAQLRLLHSLVTITGNLYGKFSPCPATFKTISIPDRHRQWQTCRCEPCPAGSGRTHARLWIYFGSAQYRLRAELPAINPLHRRKRPNGPRLFILPVHAQIAYITSESCKSVRPPEAGKCRKIVLVYR